MNLALAAAPALLNAALAGCVLTALVWLALRLPRTSASTRYAVWLAALAAVAVLPLLLGRREPAAQVRAEGPRAAVTAERPAKAPAADRGVRPAAEPVPGLALDGGWAAPLFSFWILGTALMLTRLLIGAVHLRALRLAGRPFTPPVEIPAPVSTVQGLTSPLAIGLFDPLILLPEGLASELQPDEMAHVLLHEYAHIRRADAWTILAQRLAEAMYFFHPAVWLIGRQMNLEREIACDDWAVSVTRQPKPYAACLARMLELRPAGGSLLATGASLFPKQITRRIEMLLDQQRNSKPKLSLVVLASMAALLVAGLTAFYRAPRAVVPGAEARATPQGPFDIRESRNVSYSHNGDERSVTWSSGWEKFTVRARGEIEFTADDRDIAEIGAGGSFEIEESSWFLTDRRLVLTAERGGGIARVYEVQGIPKPYGPEARAWLAGALPAVIRESGIGAELRVRRILAQRGPTGVLEEIGRMHRDSPKSLYFQHLIESRPLDTAMLDRVLRRVGRDIGSDGEKVRLFESTLDTSLASSQGRAALLEAAQSIHSDGEKSRLLEAVLAAGGEGTVALAVKAVSRINSDGEKARVLLRAATLAPPRADFFRSAATIRSDGERTRVLLAVLDESRGDRETVAETLKAAARINSDGEKARVLARASGYFSKDDTLRGVYFLAVSSIQSDGERQRVLSTLLQRGGLSNDSLRELLRSAERLHSDGEKARLLIEFTQVCPKDEELLSAVLDAAATIGSDGEYRRVVSAITEKNNGKTVTGKKAKA